MHRRDAKSRVRATTSVLAKAQEKRGRYHPCFTDRDRTHKKRENIPHGAAMPIIEQEQNCQSKCHKMPQYLKPIHHVDFQCHAAKQTEKICKRSPYEFGHIDRVCSGSAPITMQMTVTESAPTTLDFAESYWLDS